jgi:membrane protein
MHGQPDPRSEPTSLAGDNRPSPAAQNAGWKGWWSLVKAAAKAWSADYAPSMGAALSYYSVFSLAPLLLIVIAVAGMVFGEDAVRGEIFEQLHGLVGADASQAIEGLLASANKPAEGIASSVIGGLLLLVGATTVFGELQDALDRIWRVPMRERASGLWSLLRSRLLSFGMILGIAFLLMVSLVFSAAIAALGKWWAGAGGAWEVAAQAINLVLGFALTTAVFAMIYKLMPRADVRWHDVWLGAAVTAGLFTLGRFLIGLYIGKSGVASTFGAAGSLIVVFVWVYYSAQIFLIGAEFTWVYANTFGSMRHEPKAALQATHAPPGLPAVGDVPMTPSPAAAQAVPPARRRSTGSGQIWAGLAVVAGGMLLRWALRKAALSASSRPLPLNPRPGRLPPVA